MTKGAIFDVDGTILDSMLLLYGVAERYFARYEKTLTPELSEKITDMRLEDSLPLLIDYWKMDMTPEEALQGIKDMMKYEYEHSIQAKPYVCEYIKSLHDRGVKIAVATSGYIELCSLALKRIGVLEYIDAFAFSWEVNCPKSKPDVYLLAAERIGLKPHECTVYEDILIGIQSSKKADFKTCAIDDATNQNDTDMLKGEADMFITSWKELL